jgi:hypothetical protein
MTHMRQPMHFAFSTTTTPCSFRLRAPVLQAAMHAASSHCRQAMGTFCPPSKRWTEILDTAGRNSLSFPIEHAISQLPHPMHFSGEMSNTFSMISAPPF